MMRMLCARVLAMSAAIGMCCAGASAQITIPTVPIGDTGNAPDPNSSKGSVSYTYNIGQTEVTNAQYAAFLNAVAATDTHSLYNTNMSNSFVGITRSGSPGSYTYSAVLGRENNPVGYVSFWDATRFANWLHNGQPTGPQDASTTEDGAYTLTPDGISANTITRNAGWQWAMASEDEWYKAAYHQPASVGGDADDYWRYPTSSNTVPIAGLPPAGQANYFNAIGNTTPVGSYPANFYSVFDIAGNVMEWNESILFDIFRCVLGGSFGSHFFTLRAGEYYEFSPSSEVADLGFRVTQVFVPPPCGAEYNGSGDEGDIADLMDFMSDFGECTNRPAPCGTLGDADVNGDTIVDILDFLDFLDAFGQGC